MTEITSKFEFEEQIGRGGWAEVWKAKDLALRRQVAIKLLVPGGSTISSATAHAQALARVSHPNVVSIYEVGTCAHPENREIYDAIVMELLSGSTLQALYDRGLTEHEANNYGLGLLAGLEALHDAGIVHTDLHGENVMVHNGVPKLLDVLYRGTLALQPVDLRRQLFRQDIKQAISELACLLVHSGRPDAASAFRRIAGNAENVAVLRECFAKAIESAVKSKAIGSPSIDVAAWHSDCLTRFREALTGEPAQTVELYRLGHWSVAYTLASGRTAPADLLTKMEAVQGWTGWPPWWVPTRQDWRPYSKGGKIECWIKDPPTTQDTTTREPSNADFWLASPNAGFFLLRGFDEDSAKGLHPGSALSAYLPMWRIGECVFHAIQMHRLLECGDTEVDFLIGMRGLANRTLIYWPSPHGKLEAGGISRDDGFDYKFSFRPPQEKVSPEALLSILKKPLDTLFEQFAFAKVSPSVYIQEFRRMMRR